MNVDTNKSKSQLKRELHALQQLGRDLVELPPKSLLKLSLSEPLFDAIREARGLNRGARQRQLRYIGGLLPRDDVARIRSKLHDLLYPGREAAERFHKVEQWRDALLVGDEQAINDVVARFPGAQRQQLRQFVRKARKEAQQNKPPKAARLLFQYLRKLLDAPA